jgi:glycyl-tRNA synthetase beta chain
MGRYYALEAGEPAAVADAARDHYAPLGPSDAVPVEPVSVAVALADKIDTLTGFWAIDEKPTGSKDPFALRRAVLGVIRLVVGNGVRTKLDDLLSLSFETQYARARSLADIYLFGVVEERNGSMAHIAKIGQSSWTGHPTGMEYVLGFLWEGDVEDALQKWRAKQTDLKHDVSAHRVYMKLPTVVGPNLLAFFHERLKVYLKDQGVRHDVIDACLAMPGSDDLTLLVKRATALSDTLKTEDGANLLQGFRRANNILSQAEAKDGVEYSFGADVKFADTDAERALFAALDAAEAKIGPAMAAEDFAAAMGAMAALRRPIDAFFDAVQVNDPNPILRRNRLNLLHRIRAVCSGVADLTRIEG